MDVELYVNTATGYFVWMWKRLFPSIARMEPEKRAALPIVAIFVFALLLKAIATAMEAEGWLHNSGTGWH